MLHMLDAGWDTVLLGNKLNIAIWNQEFGNKCNDSDWNQRKLTVAMDIAATVTLFFSALPIFITLFVSFRDALGNAELLAILVATTPCQVITIQHLSDTIELFVKLNDKLRRTKQLSNMLDFTQPLSNEGKISWGNINLTYGTVTTQLQCYDDLQTITNQFAKGRYTLTGHNGSGKTTLLTQIKKSQGANAYLLPSNSKMYFKNDAQLREFSTGEKMFEILMELSTNVKTDEISVMLLDEWNANLDSGNFKSLNDLIDKLSEKFCVIEVLHKF